MAEPKKKKKTKEHDSSKYIDLEPTIDEAAGKTAVIAWGRMNPITAGHEKLANRVKAVAKSEKGEPMIFLTHSFDKKKNPLKYDDKIRYAQKAFGKAVRKSNSKTIIQAMQELQGKYKNLVLVAGSDRVKEFEDLLNKYNGKDYSFDSIKVVSAGQRDPDSDAVDGISGTKMREFAAKNDATNFAKNLPRNLRPSASEIMDVVRDGMGMSEEVELDEVLDRQQRRKRALAMKRARFKIKRGREKAMRKVASTDVLKKRAHKAALKVLKKKFSKGRYADMSAGEKMIVDKKIEKINKKRIEAIARKLFPSIKKMERERKSNMARGGSSKNESVMNEASQVDTKVRARPHMLMDKNNKPKFDGRFKMFKKKVNESAEDLNEEILDLMEATEALAEAGGAGEEGTDKLVKKYKKDTPLSERATGDQIKVAVGKLFNKKNYKAALEYMKKTGKSPADVARIYRGVDARELASMAESVELDEAIKFKINRNTYFMGKDVGPVYTHHSGYSIAKVSGKWIVSNPDDEKAGEFKSLAAAKSEVANMVNESVELDEVSSSLLRRAADSAAKKGDDARQRGMTAAHGLQSTKDHGDEAEKRAKQRGKFSRASTKKKMKELGVEEGFQDREKRAFKRKEHEAEWKREQEIERRKKQTDSEEHHVYINGKVWKKDGKPVAFNGKRHANSAGVSIQKKDPKKDVRIAHHSYTKKHGGVLKK